MTTSKRVILYTFGLLIAALLMMAAYTWAMLSVSYSDGERAGYLQKFSTRGWICKTWEGEQALVSLPGTARNLCWPKWRSGVSVLVCNISNQRLSCCCGRTKSIPR